MTYSSEYDEIAMHVHEDIELTGHYDRVTVWVQVLFRQEDRGYGGVGVSVFVFCFCVLLRLRFWPGGKKR